jgi:hypothetical protein
LGSYILRVYTNSILAFNTANQSISNIPLPILSHNQSNGDKLQHKQIAKPYKNFRNIWLEEPIISLYYTAT